MGDADKTPFLSRYCPIGGRRKWKHYKTLGYLGIGTAEPIEKFEVNGVIRAKEVKVEAVNWPDYVFEDHYQSPSLQELGNYIKKNKHLPGIPDKNEVKQEGVNLGEMNRKLLEKVEELTLHLIEKDEEIKRLTARVDAMEKQ